jgi:serine/threonine protein kinase
VLSSTRIGAGRKPFDLSDQETAASGKDRVGEQVGGYTIEKVLGVGGMGHVYLAAGPAGEKVALKLVKADLARDDVFRRRFEREARIAQQIRHPNVVPVSDRGEHEGVPYLAQQYIAGGNLAELIEKEGQLELGVVCGVAEQVAAGLDALHSEGLFHRDIKPANILLDEAGTAYITDFGLAKDTQGSLLTKPGQALGSLDYMAPEQIRSEEITPAADVYGLGCVIYECLCSAPPFADRQGMRVLWAHLQDPPAKPVDRRSDLPAAVSDAILGALAKDPAERPQSAGDFARQLKAACSA